VTNPKRDDDPRRARPSTNPEKDAGDAPEGTGPTAVGAGEATRIRRALLALELSLERYRAAELAAICEVAEETRLELLRQGRRRDARGAGAIGAAAAAVLERRAGVRP
jgi:hypothetical protein